MTHVPRYFLVLLLALGGCHTYRAMPPPESSPEPPASLAEYAARLATLDAAGRSQALIAAEADWQAEKNPEARARLGLARAQWGHPEHDPKAAAEDLAAALSAESADWPAYDRAFLSLRIRQLERDLDRRRTHEQLARENERLRQALDEAERKLRALSEIEEQIGP